MVEIVFENKNLGKKAKKKIVTFGFKTFIKKPVLNNCDIVFLGTLSTEIRISSSLLKTLYAKYNKYKAPNNLIKKKQIFIFIYNG